MINTLLQHRSIRKYSGREIPQDVLTKILEAASRASTTGNMQVYSIIVTAEQQIKEKLWEAHFRQNMVKQAPLVFTFCADFNRFNKWCSFREAIPGYDNFLSFMTGAIDALLAAQNFAIAAESYGLGICYLGTTTYNADEIIDILNLPQAVVPVTTIVAGYREEVPELTDRLPLESIVHKEIYSDFDKEIINKLDEVMRLLNSIILSSKKNNIAN
jgi:nitroreductase